MSSGSGVSAVLIPEQETDRDSCEEDQNEGEKLVHQRDRLET